MHTYSKKQHSTNTVFKKKRRKERIVYVCTKDVSEIRQKKEKSNNMAYPKEKRISKLVFPLSVKSKDK
jgi:hypothetical protein